jgi:hypothetical protein
MLAEPEVVEAKSIEEFDGRFDGGASVFDVLKVYLEE